MKCPSCGAEAPDDALFCIECGAGLRLAATGPTTALPAPAADVLVCGVCSAANPAHAAYCVRCGALIKGHVPILGVNTPERRGRSTKPLAPPPPVWRADRGGELIGMVAFLIGFGVLMLARAPIWPGILFIIGLTIFLTTAARGRIIEGLFGVLWLFGLGVLFMLPRTIFLPGLLVLIGLTILIDVIRRSASSP
ncbi:MAG: zinc ribbon domain-containing protein [Oscillochloridaceae bacterium]|nr:zinc ribbon domain-containing protein [Chloroflexaceae bacterium]MDW8388604.1 zinc ribbon domain-containing protein [Oscillochloridaceae bacterium]